MKFKKVFCAMVMTLITLAHIQPALALDDGAYLIGRSTSYVNPLTGQSEDGGTQITLGENMVKNIIPDQLLLEKVNGQYYITIGIGLASNISQVRFQVMDQQGQKSSRTPVQTGSSADHVNNDTIKHYRIQVDSLSQYIVPTIYVEPMGRDVIFFIQLNQSAISSGTGIYQSKLVAKDTKSKSSSSSKKDKNDTQKAVQKQEKSQTSQSKNEDAKKQSTQEKTAQKQETTTSKAQDVSKESLFQDVQGLSYHQVSSKDAQTFFLPYMMITTITLVALAALGGYFYVKKIKK